MRPWALFCVAILAGRSQADSHAHLHYKHPKVEYRKVNASTTSTSSVVGSVTSLSSKSSTSSTQPTVVSSSKHVISSSGAATSLSSKHTTSSSAPSLSSPSLSSSLNDSSTTKPLVGSSTANSLTSSSIAKPLPSSAIPKSLNSSSTTKSLTSSSITKALNSSSTAKSLYNSSTTQSSTARWPVQSKIKGTGPVLFDGTRNATNVPADPKANATRVWQGHSSTRNATKGLPFHPSTTRASVGFGSISKNGTCTGCRLNAISSKTTTAPKYTKVIVTETVLNKTTSYFTGEPPTLEATKVDQVTLSQTKTVVLAGNKTVTNGIPTFTIVPMPGVTLERPVGPTYVIYQGMEGGPEAPYTRKLLGTRTAVGCSPAASSLSYATPTRSEDWDYFIETISEKATATGHVPIKNDKKTALPRPLLDYLKRNQKLMADFEGHDIATCTLPSQNMFGNKPGHTIDDPIAENPVDNIGAFPFPPTHLGERPSLPPAGAKPPPRPWRPEPSSEAATPYLSTTFRYTSTHLTVRGCLRCEEPAPTEGPLLRNGPLAPDPVTVPPAPETTIRVDPKPVAQPRINPIQIGGDLFDVHVEPGVPSGDTPPAPGTPPPPPPPPNQPPANPNTAPQNPNGATIPPNAPLSPGDVPKPNIKAPANPNEPAPNNPVPNNPAIPGSPAPVNANQPAPNNGVPNVPSIPGNPAQNNPSQNNPVQNSPSPPNNPVPNNPSLPNIPGSNNPSLPNTPGSNNPSVPNTPASNNPSLPNTPGSNNPSSPNIPAPNNPSLPNNPAPNSPSLPNNPGSNNPSLPNSPGSNNPSLPNTIGSNNPSANNPSLPNIPGANNPSSPNNPVPNSPSLPGSPAQPSPQSNPQNANVPAQPGQPGQQGQQDQQIGANTPDRPGNAGSEPGVNVPNQPGPQTGINPPDLLRPAPQTSAGSQLGQAPNAPGNVVIGSQTLSVGQTTTINGATVVVPTSGGGSQLIVDGTTHTIQPAPPAITPKPSISIGGNVIQGSVIGGTPEFVLGQSNTLTLGGVVTVSGSTFSMPASGAGSVVVVDGATSTLSAAPPALTLDGQSKISASVKDGTTGFVVAPGQTLAPGSAVTVSGSTFSMPSSASGSVLVVNGASSTLSGSSPVITVGGPQAISGIVKDGTTAFAIAPGQTLAPGNAVTLSSTTFSMPLSASGSVLVVNGASSTLSGSSPAITLGGDQQAISGTVKDGTTAFAIAPGQTLAPGAVVTVSGTTYSMPASASGSVLVVNGASSTISAPTPVITIGSGKSTVSASVKDGTTAFSIAPGQTIAPGSALTVSGTTYSMPASASGSVLVVNGVTSTLPAPAPVMTLPGGFPVTATTKGGTTAFVVGSGQTLTPGGNVTVSGTIYSMSSAASGSGYDVVVYGQASTISFSPTATAFPTPTGGRSPSDVNANGAAGKKAAPSSPISGGGNRLSMVGFDKWFESVVVGLVGWAVILL